MRLNVCITGLGLLGSAGSNPEENWESLRAGKNYFSREREVVTSKLNANIEATFEDFRKDKYLALVDRVALMGIYVAKQASAAHAQETTMVLMGTSRGAVEVLEKKLEEFGRKNSVEKYLSLSTHIASLSSAISHALGLRGNSLTLSAACTSGIQSIGIAATLIESGQATSAIAGASESPLTDFTVQQLSSLGVLAKSSSEEFPTRPFHPSRTGAVYGEGAAALFLEKNPSRPAYAIIRGFGAAYEKGMNPGLSEEAVSLQIAINQALEQAQLKASDIDLIIGHGSGTLAGDRAENLCYQSIFGQQMPTLSFNKWSIGHFIGGAGAANAVIACLHLRDNFIHAHPYFSDKESPLGKTHSKKMKFALVTAMGLGGGGSALILENPL